MRTQFYSLFIVLTLFAVVQPAFPQGTAFTYQGELQNNTSPANGLFDFQFSLSNAPSGGGQIGSTLSVSAVEVTNGLFTTTLDFGPVFTGSPAWLAVSVCSNGVGNYVPLSPLQPLTPVPFALYSPNAGAALTAASATSAAAATTSATANNFSGVLAGDVTGTQAATVVSQVGGLPAASVAGGANAANAANSTGTASTIVSRDATGSFTAGSLTLNGNVTLAGTTASAGVIYAGGRTLMHSYGIYNFFAGSGAGNLTLTGTANTGLGSNALHVITTAFDNTAVGHDSLMGNTGGNDNTAIGGDSLEANTTGNNNTAAGAGVLQSNITGGNNTADGKQVLTANLTGGNNTGVGYQVLYTTTNASDNTGVGYQAIYNASGNYNIALGYQAGFNFAAGSSNICIGNMGLSADTNITRLGSTQTKAYIAGQIFGNGTGLTNLPASAIVGGITTNLAVLVPGGHTNTLFFTNGVLMAIQ